MVEVGDLHIDPSDAGAPRGPQEVVETGSGGLGDPPLAALQIAADNVGLAVAVEVAYSYVHPSRARAPHSPRNRHEGGAGG